MYIWTKIFLDGEWLGVVDILQGIDLTRYLKEQRTKGKIMNEVGIVLDIFRNEIRINMDEGRLMRPLIRCKNNESMMTKELIEEIKGNRYVTWNDFYTKHANVIEYLDIEEIEFAMLALTNDDLHEMKRRM